MRSEGQTQTYWMLLFFRQQCVQLRLLWFIFSVNHAFHHRGTRFSTKLVLLDQLDFYFTISSPYSFIILLSSATVKQTSTPGDRLSYIPSPGYVETGSPPKSHRSTRMVYPSLTAIDESLSPFTSQGWLHSSSLWKPPPLEPWILAFLMATNFRRIHSTPRNAFHSRSFGLDLRCKLECCSPTHPS